MRNNTQKHTQKLFFFFYLHNLINPVMMGFRISKGWGKQRHNGWNNFRAEREIWPFQNNNFQFESCPDFPDLPWPSSFFKKYVRVRSRPFLSTVFRGPPRSKKSKPIAEDKSWKLLRLLCFLPPFRNNKAVPTSIEYFYFYSHHWI